MKLSLALFIVSVLVYPSMAAAQSEADEREAAAKAYEIADELLNTTYNQVEALLSKEEKAQMLAEQRKWLAMREANANDAAKSMEGSNYYNRIRDETMTPITVDRYAELLKRYLERYVDVIMKDADSE